MMILVIFLSIGGERSKGRGKGEERERSRNN